MEFKAVGLRLPEKTLKELNKVGEEQELDRSTVARQMLLRGLRDYYREKAVHEYEAGRLTASKAAEMAEMTVWEFEEHLVREGFRSGYSLDDLGRELGVLSYR